MVSVQAGAAWAKHLFPLVGAAGTTALRVTLAALILALMIRPWRGGYPKGDWLVLTVYGASLGLMNLLFYSALQTVPLGVAVAIEFIGPLGVAVAASRRVTDFLWVLLAAAGLLALLPIWRQPHALDLVGVLLSLAAGGCWALYIVFGQKAGAAHGAKTTAWGMMIATLVALPVGAAHAGLALFSPPVLIGGVGVALFSSVVPYTFEMFALTRLSSRVFGTLMSLEPAVAALFGLILLHEALTPLQCVAIGVIMLASFGTVLTSRGDQPHLSDPPATAGADGSVQISC
jgi:inner membrane transporter RhtA